MKTYTEEELAVIGLEIIEGRRKGGKTILKRYGRGYFSNLAKLSNKKRAENKIRG